MTNIGPSDPPRTHTCPTKIPTPARRPNEEVDPVPRPPRTEIQSKQRLRRSVLVFFALRKTFATLGVVMTGLGLFLVAQGSTGADPRGLDQVESADTVPSWQRTGPKSRAEMASFLDHLMSQEMSSHHIAGAAVAVVKDGKPFYTKGYGYADVQKRVRVDPVRSNFRIGSLAKLFTWTAVMQLAEQGKLDLNADINEYLDFRVPSTYPQPITLRDLMTHTAGFEDLYYERAAKDQKDLLPPRTWLVTHMPARVHPPGEVPAYSSYGAALAGYIVSRVSGESFAHYVQQHILDPLGMTHTTAEPSMPPAIRAHTSAGYVYTDGGYHQSPDPSELKGAKLAYADMGQPALVPSGDMQSSAADMARFMIASLRDRHEPGQAGTPRLLKAATLRGMHRTLHTPAPGILGTSYGFFDFTENGQRTIGHVGGSDPIFSLLLLLPGQHLGVFVVYNSAAGEDLTLQHLGFQRAFFDHYYPTQAVRPLRPPAHFAETAGRFVGTYRITGGSPGTSYTTIEKSAGIFGIDTVTISNPGDGTLLFTNPWGKWRFVEESPLYFRQVDRPLHIRFLVDRSGNVTDLVTDYTPMFAFEKLPWYETPRFSMTFLWSSVAIFVSLLVAATVRAVLVRRRSRFRDEESRGARAAYRTLVAASLLNIAFLAGIARQFNPVPLFGYPTAFKLVLTLAVLAAALTMGAVLGLIPAWKVGFWSLPARVHYTAVTVTAVAFIWFLNYWKLLGWRYHPQ